MSHSDVWAVTPSTNNALLFAAAPLAGAGAITLLTNTIGLNGTGYKLLIESAGNSSNRTFTVVGVKVGDTALTTEEITGPNATTTTSTNFYTTVNSITISGASTGNITIGTTGSLALPRTRVKAVHYVGAANAGSIKLNSNGASGTLLLQVNTPATATFAEMVPMPGDGVFTGRSAATDYAVVTLTQVANVTLLCG